jgi:putative oxidoreductase
MKVLIQKLVTTNEALNPVILRLFLGLVMLPHGLQKTIGSFGGYGFSGTMGFFTDTLGLPWLVALLVILGESLGAIGLITGTISRFCAAGLVLIMSGAIAMAHWQHGFFMNWYGKQQGEGFEYHLLVIGMALALMVSGSGRWSIDRMIQKQFTS